MHDKMPDIADFIASSKGDLDLDENSLADKTAVSTQSEEKDYSGIVELRES